MGSPTTSLVEIFSGIQGEGVHVGLRQLFVRLALCNLRCAWCDTPDSWHEPVFASCESVAGSRIFDRHPNPLTLDDFLSLAGRFDPAAHHSLVLTGGEPLVSAGFLEIALPRLRQAGWKLFLETNGSLGGALTSVAPFIDFVSLDIKLPVTDDSLDFLAAAAAARTDYGCAVHAKIVVAADTAADDLLAAVSAASSQSIQVTLQPVSPPPAVSQVPPATSRAPLATRHTQAASMSLHEIRHQAGSAPLSDAPAASAVAPSASDVPAALPPSAARLLELQAAALTVASDVRVIPQVHKLMGQM